MDGQHADVKAEIDKLKLELEEAEKALPAHSVRPGQMMRVLELEEKLEAAEKRIEELGKA